ncbi:ER membrane protein complex subunit 10 [Copidosoma floridanum]|uniref:ER membrane protein complex subunit 10 n=1 Tax=Copidosoma floridanum TaxID=29053 RepID=UPI0006C9444D|nr:ER membrane protein complex subunit 10 [Copidosoma floridanum]
MSPYYQSVLLFLSSFLLASASELDYDGWLQIRLSHALSSKTQSDFTERGNITVSSIRSGSFVITQPALTAVDQNKLLKLAANNHKYLLRATIKTSTGSETSFLASILACNLVGSDLQDSIHVWLDSTGEPVAVNILAKGPCVQDSRGSFNNKFMTDVEIRYPDGGPAPDTFSYIQKIEKEKQARESGDAKYNNKTFFAKYWMYIVPAVIFFVLSSATNPDAAGGGNGGGGGAAAIQRQ